MDRNLLFFTMALVCLWLLLDEFVGQKRITKVVNSILDGVGSQRSESYGSGGEFWNNGDTPNNGLTPKQEDDILEGRLTNSEGGGINGRGFI